MGQHSQTWPLSCFSLFLCYFLFFDVAPTKALRHHLKSLQRVVAEDTGPKRRE